MEPNDGARRGGPWQGRVSFSQGLAYRPGEVLMRQEFAEPAERELARVAADGATQRSGVAQPEEVVGGAYVRFSGLSDPLAALATLRRAGIPAQVNHVLFATCCCPPHPASRPVPCGSSHADPEEMEANPYYANPYYANPYYANPYYANPYYANAGGGGCCGCGGGPLGPNPYYANPYYANPYYANADPHPSTQPPVQATGRRRSSARPASPPQAATQKAAPSVQQVRVAVLDTGWAQSATPTGLAGIAVVDTDGGDHPDEDVDGFLDPAAGHGTFIAGVIEQDAPGCLIESFPSLSTYGDGDEADIAGTLVALAARPDEERPHLVNLSFGGYSPMAMDALAHAVRALRLAGTVVVASAGNDATCVPMYPAALPGVVGVAALDDDGAPAVFTNYGPWVRACAPGVDVVSVFFEGFDGAEPSVDGADEDAFDGWAVWSGTSFAAPRVVAALARVIAGGATPHDAVTQVIDAPGLAYEPLLGTRVPRP